jgi:hypothetical protein
MLKRSPRFLRVTQDDDGQFDALDDQLDTPRVTEKLFAYEVVGDTHAAFIDFGGKAKKSSGLYSVATYRFIEEQPSDVEMRLTTLWDLWVRTHQGRATLEA